MKTICDSFVYLIMLLGYFFSVFFRAHESNGTVGWSSAVHFVSLLIILLLSATLYSRKRKRVKIREAEDKAVHIEAQNAFLQRLATEQLQGTSADVRGIPGDQRWDLLKREINKTNNQFTVRLKAGFPRLKEEDIRLCCLIRIGMNTLWIIQYLNISKEYFRKKKSRLAKNLQVRNDKRQLEQFILEF